MAYYQIYQPHYKLLTNFIVIDTIDTNSIKTKPSLRYINEDDGQNHNYIKVTPEFQEFVAKNLFKHLER